MTDLRLDVSDGVATVTIDRPDKYNAMTLDMWHQLTTVVSTVEKNDAIRVLLLTGGHNFSAGADITEFQNVRRDAAAGRRYDAVVDEAEQALTQLRIPTIAVVRGFCIGGGCEIALSCDIRLVADDSVFAITPAKVGLVYSVTGTRRLVDTVGPAWAKQILFTAERIDAQTALRIGLVNEVHTDSQVMERAHEVAHAIARGAQTSITSSKILVERILRHRTDQDDLSANALCDAAYDSRDYAEGVAAFIEKRAPDFGYRSDTEEISSHRRRATTT
ncbi:hypothetical protein AXA44_10945 [Rhodococcus sp. SC4]|nr:hypothetical protein AXA44_10945 [Rhodococcus sp. SC4]